MIWAIEVESISCFSNSVHMASMKQANALFPAIALISLYVFLILQMSSLPFSSNFFSALLFYVFLGGSNWKHIPLQQRNPS